MSVRQQIRDAIIAALNADPPTGVPDCSTRRFVPGRKLVGASLAAIFLSEESRLPQGRAGAITARSFVLGLQAAVAVEDPAEADDAIEVILEHTTETLGNTNLGNLATHLEEVGTAWAASDAAAAFILVALQRWRIEYQTRRDDLTVRS